LQAKIQFSFSKQLGDILFEKLKLEDLNKENEDRSICNRRRNSSKDSRNSFSNIRWRSLIKLQNTYVEALPLQVDAVTKRIHTDYMQTVAATGRLSSTNPNLQNIPIRTERDKKIRKHCARDENYTIISADYSQIELRIAA
jgi:DNA polymerase-1